MNRIDDRSAAYDRIDRYLRNNLQDVDYEEFSAALECLWQSPAPMELPELPEPDVSGYPSRDDPDEFVAHSPDQLREFGEACFRAGMERAAKIAEWCDGESHIGPPEVGLVLKGAFVFAAAAIRKELECSPSTTK